MSLLVVFFRESERKGMKNLKGIKILDIYLGKLITGIRDNFLGNDVFFCTNMTNIDTIKCFNPKKKVIVMNTHQIANIIWLLPCTVVSVAKKSN